ncbi:MAG: lipoprotein [Erysipelotrichaceae bacterium]|nr:lipoprotein [Erysipelotrichaceae bacterium]
MKKPFLLLLIATLLSGCMLVKPEREDFYIFSFDDFTIAPGYDDVEFMRLVFDLDLPDQLAAKEKLSEREVFFWDRYFAEVDIENNKDEETDISEAVITRFVYYLSNYPASVYKINDIELCDSVKQNCEMFSGEYIERNGYACAFGQKSAGRNQTVILYGDIFGIDQDKLDHVEITVE